MDYYFEITLLPDAEFMPTMLMSILYAKLHRALVKLGGDDIGVSFPEYGQKLSESRKQQWLGTKVRIHGSRERLDALMNSDWLIGMNDHLRISQINPIPRQVKYAVFQRVQAKGTIDRIRRRYMRRHNLTDEQVLERIPEVRQTLLKEPFVTIKSQSTEQVFRLFIKMQESPAAKSGTFSTYGLSKDATVPWF